MREACKSLQQVRYAFAHGDGTGEEHIEAVARAVRHLAEAFQPHTIGDGEYFFCRDAFRQKRAPRDPRRHHDRIRLFVARQLAALLPVVAYAVGQAPTGELFLKHTTLEGMMGRPPVAQEDPAALLHFFPSIERGAGQCYQGVARRNASSEPGIEGLRDLIRHATQ